LFRLSEKRRLKEVLSATKIQALYHGFITRRKVKLGTTNTTKDATDANRVGEEKTANDVKRATEQKAVRESNHIAEMKAAESMRVVDEKSVAEAQRVADENAAAEPNDAAGMIRIGTSLANLLPAPTNAITIASSDPVATIADLAPDPGESSGIDDDSHGLDAWEVSANLGHEPAQVCDVCRRLHRDCFESHACRHDYQLLQASCVHAGLPRPPASAAPVSSGPPSTVRVRREANEQNFEGRGACVRRDILGKREFPHHQAGEATAEFVVQPGGGPRLRGELSQALAAGDQAGLRACLLYG
jgi:hypothetical protein